MLRFTLTLTGIREPAPERKSDSRPATVLGRKFLLPVSRKWRRHSSEIYLIQAISDTSSPNCQFLISISIATQTPSPSPNPSHIPSQPLTTPPNALNINRILNTHRRIPLNKENIRSQTLLQHPSITHTESSCRNTSRASQSLDGREPASFNVQTKFLVEGETECRSFKAGCCICPAV